MRAEQVNTDTEQMTKEILGSLLWKLFGTAIMKIVNRLLDKWGLRTPDGGTVF